jgi:hypothetical protein
LLFRGDDEALILQLCNEAQNVFGAAFLRYVELFGYRGDDIGKNFMLFDELPDSGAYLIESEIYAGFEVEENGVALEFLEEDVIADFDCGRCGHIVSVVAFAGCPARVRIFM